LVCKDRLGSLYFSCSTALLSVNQKQVLIGCVFMSCKVLPLPLSQETLFLVVIREIDARFEVQGNSQMEMTSKHLQTEVCS
jgi:hypothetical protein